MKWSPGAIQHRNGPFAPSFPCRLSSITLILFACIRTSSFFALPIYVLLNILTYTKIKIIFCRCWKSKIPRWLSDLLSVSSYFCFYLTHSKAFQRAKHWSEDIMAQLIHSPFPSTPHRIYLSTTRNLHAHRKNVQTLSHDIWTASSQGCYEAALLNTLSPTWSRLPKSALHLQFALSSNYQIGEVHFNQVVMIVNPGVWFVDLITKPMD